MTTFDSGIMLFCYHGVTKNLSLVQLEIPETNTHYFGSMQPSSGEAGRLEGWLPCDRRCFGIDEWQQPVRLADESGRVLSFPTALTMVSSYSMSAKHEYIVVLQGKMRVAVRTRREGQATLPLGQEACWDRGLVLVPALLGIEFSNFPHRSDSCQEPKGKGAISDQFKHSSRADTSGGLW